MISGCMEGHVLIEGECLEQVDPGDLCVDDKQCLGGSKCDEGVCECPKGQHIQRGKCVQKETKAVPKCPITGQTPYFERGSSKVILILKSCKQEISMVGELWPVEIKHLAFHLYSHAIPVLRERSVFDLKEGGRIFHKPFNFMMHLDRINNFAPDVRALPVFLV